MTEEQRDTLNSMYRQSFATILRTIQSEEASYAILLNIMENLNKDPFVQKSLDPDIAQIKALMVMMHLTADYFTHRITQNDYFGEEE